MTGTTRATPVLLWTRAALLAVVAVAVSVVGHVSADGLLPGPLVLAVLVGVTTVVSARFLTHQASAGRITVLLVAGQAAVHTVLSLAAGHGTAPARVSSAPAYDGRVIERSGSHFDQATAMHAAAVERIAETGASSDAGHGGWSHLADHLVSQSPAMLLAHFAVVVVLGLWLAVGERALWTVVVLSTTRLHDLAEGAVLLLLGRWAGGSHGPVLRVRVVVARRRTVVPLPQLLHHVVAHRGPPALLAA